MLRHRSSPCYLGSMLVYFLGIMLRMQKLHVGRWFVPVFKGFDLSELTQDLVHPQQLLEAWRSFN